jgi:polyisoprenoid-binding protein YceI
MARVATRTSLIFALLVVAGCQAPAPQPTGSPATAVVPDAADLAAPYRKAEAAGAEVFTLDATASSVRLFVYRGGKAARAGHNHVIGVGRFEGYVVLDAVAPADSRFDLRVPVDGLVIDDSAWREAIGGAFGSARSESDIEGTRRNLLGPKVLDATRFPNVDLRSQAVAGDWPLLVADVAITIKGVTRVQPVLLQFRREGPALRIGGEFVLRQSDFAMVPFSVLGGLMAVQDLIGVRFDLVGRPGVRR